MTVSHWFHLNTYLSLGIIVAMLVAAIVFSLRRNKQMAAGVADTRGALSRRGDDRAPCARRRPARPPRRVLAAPRAATWPSATS